jgi:hypothetical protein
MEPKASIPVQDVELVSSESHNGVTYLKQVLHLEQEYQLLVLWQHLFLSFS